MNEEKEIFVKKFKARTKRFAVETIKFCESLKSRKSSSVITYQLIKSATSTGANYRAACNARSQKEFYSKICIVSEEADESVYWLEIIKESNLSNEETQLNALLQESIEISKIVNKAKFSVYNKLQQ